MVIQPLHVGFVINLLLRNYLERDTFYCAVVAALGILIAGCSYLWVKTRYCQLQIDSAVTIERQLIDKIQHADSSFFRHMILDITARQITILMLTFYTYTMRELWQQVLSVIGTLRLFYI